MNLGVDKGLFQTATQFPNFSQDGNVPRFYSYLKAFTSGIGLTTTFTDIYSGSTGVSGVSMKGLIQARNGFVYVFPASGGQVLKFDPTTESAMERPAGLTNMFATSLGASIHLDDSGRYIYIFSTQEQQARGIRKIDTQTDTMTTVSGTGSASRLYGVKGANGNVYFTPYYSNSANSFTKFNMDTDTFTTFGIALTPNVFGWNNTRAMCVAGNEKIYCVMRDKIVVIDPMTDSITWDSNLGLGLSSQAGISYVNSSAVLAPNLLMYVVPESGGLTSSVLKINPTSSSGLTFSFIPNSLARFNRTRGTIGSDGRLYYSNRYLGLATNCMVIDWKTDTITEFGTGLVNACCDHLSDMIVSSNGSIYCTMNDSYSTRAIKKITSNITKKLPPNFFLSRYMKNSSNAANTG